MLFLFLLLQITRSLITDRWLLALHYRRRGYCTICEFLAFTNSVIMSRRLQPLWLSRYTAFCAILSLHLSVGIYFWPWYLTFRPLKLFVMLFV